MIGIQEYIINNKIKISKLAKEIDVNPTCIYDWFKNDRVTPKYIKILSEKFNLHEEYINTKVNDICTYKPKTKFYNDFRIVGDTTILYLKNKEGQIFESIIDTKNYSKVKDIDVSWHVQWNDILQSYYCAASEYLGIKDGKPSYRTRYLHREVLGVKGRYIHVDHKNYDTLNNTEENLIITNHKDNAKNRKSKNTNNKSGYRNVCWIERYNKWCVQLQVEGKNTMLGKFDDVDEAGAFAEEMREKYYGKFKGNN